jgi:hypothetical protein
MAKLTKKQKAIIESCREEIGFIIAQATSQAVVNNWKDSEISISSVYNSFRVLNLIQDKLNNQ